MQCRHIASKLSIVILAFQAIVQVALCLNKFQLVPIGIKANNKGQGRNKTEPHI